MPARLLTPVAFDFRRITLLFWFGIRNAKIMPVIKVLIYRQSLCGYY